MFTVIPTPEFTKQIKYYYNKKNYKKIKDDIQKVITELQNGNFIGDEIPDLKLPENEHSYKVRVKNTSANLGKSNGFRIIYYLIKDDTEIYLLTIYSKKDKENISDDEIKNIINNIIKES